MSLLDDPSVEYTGILISPLQFHIPFPSILLLLLLVFSLYVSSLYRWNFWLRYPGEPPLHRSFLPWVGHAASVDRNSTKFLQKLSTQSGGVFVIPMAGRRAVWVTDPCGLKSVNRLEQLSFNPITRMVRTSAQGLAPDDFDKIDSKIRRRIEVTHLSGDSLKVLTVASVRSFDDLPNVRQFLGRPKHPAELFTSDGDYEIVELYELCRCMQFDALCGCLLGQSLPDCFDAYKTCRSLFEMVLVGLPGTRYLFSRYFDAMSLMRKAILKVAQEHVDRGTDASTVDATPSQGLSPTKSAEEDEGVFLFSAALHHRQAYHQKVGVKDALFAGVFDALFTGVNMSAPTTFWLLARLIHDRTLLREVLSEIFRVLTPDRTFSDLTYDDINNMELLEATHKEVFRFYQTAPIVRACESNCTLEVGERNFSIRKGDWVFVYPRLALHWNPDIYTDPDVFDSHRFRVDPQTNEPPVFRHRKGIPLGNTLLPFGDGRHLCPGRLIAPTVSKLCVIYLLLHLDIRSEEEAAATGVPHCRLPSPNIKATEGAPAPLGPYNVCIRRSR
eukprot:GHVS01089719.1.p1 GENE.GHVS01089719.1~~GHVS01089719.1.p1  ORF type:complete len:556 (+),score=61.65 GHVS01089719.1:215-1882(+)